MKKLVALLICAVPTMTFACGTQDQQADPDISALSISMTALDVTQVEGRSSVASLGTIKNSAPYCFDQIVVEAKYYDTNKKHIDTVVQRLYDVVVPARGQVSFRISDTAVKQKGEYAEQQVRVLNAETFGHRKGNGSDKNTFMELIVGLGPMALLISVWIFFMRKFRGKDSPQERSVALVQQQLATAELQHKALTRIAVAMESAVVHSKRDS